MTGFMRKIAFFTDGWRRYITSSWLIGMQQYISDHKLQYMICQFQCWGNWSHDPEHDRGEYTIFSLPDLAAYDGIIVDVTNILDPVVRERLLTRIRESGKPAISLCSNEAGLTYLGIDGRTPIREMVQHLYNEHCCRKFVFAGGSHDNYENEVRFEAYRETVKSLYGAESLLVTEGDYTIGAGKKAAEDIIRELHGSLPDAVVCANDNIAVGLITAFKTHGIRVPGDIKVTGFDDLDKAMYFDPQITTADLNRERIGAHSIKLMDSLINGEPCEQYHFEKSTVHYCESCGCPNSGLVDYRSYISGGILAGEDTQIADAERAAFEVALRSLGDIKAVSKRFSEHILGMGCDGCGVLLDQNVIEPKLDETLPSGKYDLKNLEVAGTAEKDTSLVFDSVEAYRNYLASIRTPGMAYIFLPLHIGALTAGFTVIRNPRFLKDTWDFYNTMEILLHVLDFYYQNMRIKLAYDSLRKVYNRDMLTGAYSRTAFTSVVETRYKEWLDSGRAVGVMFADADNFKQINDTYGHEYGDKVLSAIAHSMQRELPQEQVVCRYGGDEFLALFPCTAESVDNADGRNESADLTDRVSAEEVMGSVCARLESALLKQSIHISSGTFLASGDILIEDAIREADKRMYAVKEAHHAGRNRD